jgi:DNA helicase-2/ATP-dependent DNA helicase PcrA
MMRLIIDDQANPQVAEILTGPRFRVGLADLDKLGHRARHLAQAAVTESSAEPLSLLAAVRDPGETSFSDHARASFRRLVDDIDASRQFFGTLLDQVHRLINRIGVGVEVYASQADGAIEVRQFMAHVANFVANRPDASLTALVSYLDAEAEYSTGLQRANPTEQDAVSIMTVHRAKGLEWDTVYLPYLVDKVFPDERLTDNPLTRPDALPTAVRSDHAGLPQIDEVTNAGLKTYGDDLKQALARSEDRLAYVALTRAKRRLVMTAHRWSRGTTRPRVRSRYITAVVGLDTDQVDGQLLTDSQDDMPDSVIDRVVEPWPPADDPAWIGAAEAVRQAMAGRTTWDQTDPPQEVRDQVAAWDDRIEILERDTRASRQLEVVLPTPMSTSDVVRLEADEQAFAARLMRPVPTQPSRRADVGSRFHSWVEQFYRRSAIIPAPDPVSDQLSAFARLRRRFLASPFAAARPWLVEHDFVAVVAGQAITGRIDAVFRASDNPGLVPAGKQVLIVDWKTGHAQADPAQLTVYARAWSTLSGMPLDDVAAGFFYVSTGDFVAADLGRPCPAGMGGSGQSLTADRER